jgi:hypothetical protein
MASSFFIQDNISFIVPGDYPAILPAYFFLHLANTG